MILRPSKLPASPEGRVFRSVDATQGNQKNQRNYCHGMDRD